MARQNLGRTVGTNKTLALRIQYEREQRGWTMEALAQRMKDAGCPIHHTAVYKIEKGRPQRTVSFEEAVGFATVFGLTLDELAVPPLMARNREARRLLDELFAATKAGQEAAARITEAEARLGHLLRDVPELVGEVRTLLEPVTWTHGDSFLINLGVLTVDDDGAVVAVTPEPTEGPKRIRTKSKRLAEGEK
jgi:transcriptional regulator with XRE-family HTH domain